MPQSKIDRLRYIADRVQALGAILDSTLGDGDETVQAWVDELRQIATAIREEAR